MIRVLISTVVGSIALFVWLFFVWTISGVYNADFKQLPDESMLAPIAESVPEPGMYYVPWMPEEASPEAMEAYAEKHETSPVAKVTIYPDGRPFAAPSQMAAGFGINFANALVLSLIVLIAAKAGMGFGGRLGAALLVGVAVAFAARAVDANWMYVPWDFTIKMMGEQIINAAIVGAIAAAFIKPTPEHKAATVQSEA